MSFLSLNAEVQNKLNIYENLLLKWSASLNLVSKSTLTNIRIRHFDDSLQLLPHLQETDKIVDIGTGAGFPGMVLALCGHNVTLVEVDQKKCVFLENVSRETNSPVRVVCSRIENFLPSADERFDVVCSRGLTSLSSLISISDHLVKNGLSRGLFLKGENVDCELQEITSEHFQRTRKIQSLTHTGSSIIEYQF